MCYDSAFNYAVARCFSTELLRPSVHRMSTAAWMRSYSIFCFLLVVSHDMVQAMQQGQNCWWLRGFYFFAGLHHSTGGRCLVGTLCSGPVSSWMPCCPHLWTGKGTTLSVLESPQAVSLAKCFWFPYLQSSWFPTSDPRPRFSLPSCLASVLGIFLSGQLLRVARCCAEAWAAGTGCSTSVVRHSSPGLPARVGYASSSVVLTCLYVLRCQSTLTWNDTLQRRLKLSSQEVFLQCLSEAVSCIRFRHEEKEVI